MIRESLEKQAKLPSYLKHGIPFDWDKPHPATTDPFYDKKTTSHTFGRNDPRYGSTAMGPRRFEPLPQEMLKKLERHSKGQRTARDIAAARKMQAQGGIKGVLGRFREGGLKDTAKRMGKRPVYGRQTMGLGEMGKVLKSGIKAALTKRAEMEDTMNGYDMEELAELELLAQEKLAAFKMPKMPKLNTPNISQVMKGQYKPMTRKPSEFKGVSGRSQPATLKPYVDWKGNKASTFMKQSSLEEAAEIELLAQAELEKQGL